MASEPKEIVIIGGGIIGCSTAYFLTHHSLYNPKIHSITILEASSIAGGSSGKAGGLLADWATPKCLAPLSFKTHAQLAANHDGDKIWGYRKVHCADVGLKAQDPQEKADLTSTSTAVPSDLDWLPPDAIQSYEEVGNPKNSALVNPYMFTTTLAELAQEKGARIEYGTAKKLNYQNEHQRIASVTYDQQGKHKELKATDIVLTAGPWTSKLYPPLQLGAPRGHSIVIEPTHDLSPYVLFTSISPPDNGTQPTILSPEIYPRPTDSLHDFTTVYACGPDDFTVPLPDSTEHVAVDQQKCEDVWTAVRSVSGVIRDGEVITRQACYKPQIRPHEEGEEVGPIVGGTATVGLWIATGHDEWGVQNSAGTGLVLSEMILEGEAKSADCEGLDPRGFVKGI